MLAVDTRTRLVETAERLYAERGINGVSLREIGAAAGQRNTGAVRYHFGSKQGLLEAVFEHRMVGINERREAMLADTSADDDLPGLVAAFVLPLADMLGDRRHPSWYLRFVAHTGHVLDLGRQPWTHGVHTLRKRFDAVLADRGIPRRARRDRWLLLTGFVAHALADREQAIQHGPWDGMSPNHEFIDHVLDLAVAIAEARP